MKKVISYIIIACMACVLIAPAVTVEAAEQNVVRSPQTVTVDGSMENFEVYNISGNNYFKLRDIAYILNGTGSQFSVSYDASKSLISVLTEEGYDVVGGEMVIGTDKSNSAVLSKQELVINGVVSEITAYNIGGNNFFKLRELGIETCFNVGYDKEINTVLIESVVKIPVEATSIKLNTSELSLEDGDSYNLVADIYPENTTNKTLSWESSKENIAKVDSNGNVTAVAPGTAKIYVKTANDKTATCYLTVTKDPFLYITDLGYGAPIVKVQNDFPKTYNYINASYNTKYSSIYIEASDQYSWNKWEYLDYYELRLSFTGEKTSDWDGRNGTTYCYLAYKVYDANGYVVGSDTLHLPGYTVGDKFSNLEFNGIIEIPTRDDTYIIVFTDYYI